jgi:hypothetical protein
MQPTQCHYVKPEENKKCLLWILRLKKINLQGVDALQIFVIIIMFYFCFGIFFPPNWNFHEFSVLIDSLNSKLNQNKPSPCSTHSTDHNKPNNHCYAQKSWGAEAEVIVSLPMWHNITSVMQSKSVIFRLSGICWWSKFMGKYMHTLKANWEAPPGGIFLNWYSGRWSQIGSTRHCSHQ